MFKEAYTIGSSKWIMKIKKGIALRKYLIFSIQNKFSRIY